MNLFDSTFETLAPHYVVNVWTLAALSSWRLRGYSLPVQLTSDCRLASSSPERVSTSASTDSRPRSLIPDAAEETTTAAVSAGTAIPPSPKIATAPSACSVDGVTKGKFVTYYREDDRCDEAVLADEEVEKSGSRSCGGGAGEWWEGWDKALRIRSNGVENGTRWYHYQDPAGFERQRREAVGRGEEEECGDDAISDVNVSVLRRMVGFLGLEIRVKKKGTRGGWN